MSDYVVLDFMSLVHPFSYKLAELPPDSIPYFCDQWVMYFANPYLYTPIHNPIGFEPFTALPVLAVDSKNDRGKYWRHDFLSTYKTGRKPKSGLLIQVRDQLLATWVQYGLPTLSAYGFEADDWAGAMVQFTNPDDRIAMVSVDSDWAQLVSDRCIWLDVFPPSRRRKDPTQQKSVLGEAEVLERFNNQTKYRRTRLLTKPYDLVDHKHEFGDWESDRIPGGRSVDCGIIDLLQPLIYPPMVEDKIAGVMAGNRISVPAPKNTRHFSYGVPQWINDEYSQVGDL
jgi:hypothetical protein